MSALSAASGTALAISAFEELVGAGGRAMIGSGPATRGDVGRAAAVSAAPHGTRSRLTRRKPESWGRMMTRRAFLEAATTAVDLLADPAVAASWDSPSALPEMSVRGLAGHLARQIFHVMRVLAQGRSDEQPITLLEHYLRSDWRDADVDDDANVGIRRDAEREAAGGPEALVAQARTTLDDLRDVVPARPADLVVYLPWGPWALTFDDFLTTRMLELAVHNDDLAVSVGVETPALPATVIDPVVRLLAQLAVQRHGATAVLRALSRAERAPATIAAI